MQFLNTEGTDAIVARLVLQKAEDIRVDRERAYWKNLQNSVQAGVARAFKS